MLSDTEINEPTNISLEVLRKKVMSALRKIKIMKDLPNDIARSVRPSMKNRLPEFYGLPKAHKRNKPLRRIVADFNGPITPIFIFLKGILHQLLKFIPAHILNTTAVKCRLTKLLPELQAKTEQVIIVTMDVIAVYSTIPIEGSRHFSSNSETQTA